jgi:hypothetical protein
MSLTVSTLKKFMQVNDAWNFMWQSACALQFIVHLQWKESDELSDKSDETNTTTPVTGQKEKMQRCNATRRRPMEIESTRKPDTTRRRRRWQCQIGQENAMACEGAARDTTTNPFDPRDKLSSSRRMSAVKWKLLKQSEGNRFGKSAIIKCWWMSPTLVIRHSSGYGMVVQSHREHQVGCSKSTSFGPD